MKYLAKEIDLFTKIVENLKVSNHSENQFMTENIMEILWEERKLKNPPEKKILKRFLLEQRKEQKTLDFSLSLH